jgi:predicted helicase
VPEYWHRTEKLKYLADKENIDSIEWQELSPDARNIWLTDGIHPEFMDFLPMGTKESKTAKGINITCLFGTYSMGIVSNRDNWVYDFNQDSLEQKVVRFIEIYNAEVDRWKRRGEAKDVDSFVLYDDTKIKWSRDLKSDLQRKKYAKFETAKIRKSLYRPFTTKDAIPNVV